MPIFITQARLSQENVKNLVAHPEDRFAAVEKLVAAAGGKLLHYYATTGEYDILIISEAPDGADAVIAAMAAAAAGAVSHVVTTRGWSSAEFKTMAERAQKALASYRPTGGR
jgi:uncharacterized protein with GYD domain